MEGFRQCVYMRRHRNQCTPRAGKSQQSHWSTKPITEKPIHTHGDMFPKNRAGSILRYMSPSGRNMCHGTRNREHFAIHQGTCPQIHVSRHMFLQHVPKCMGGLRLTSQTGKAGLRVDFPPTYQSCTHVRRGVRVHEVTFTQTSRIESLQYMERLVRDIFVMHNPRTAYAEKIQTHGDTAKSYRTLHSLVRVPLRSIYHLCCGTVTGYVKWLYYLMHITLH